ncbi:MAG TPA: hypothetical protein EYH06_08475 [Chromatiales bacterium]|nr:hypothetical protein [Chromatiales bacterium]
MTTNTLINPEVPTEDMGKVNAIFNGIEEHLGFVPDGIRLYGVSPPLLESFVGAVGYFMAHQTLSQELLAMIRYLVSSDAGCSFCIDFNTGILMNQGKTAEQLQAAKENPEKAPLSDKEKVLLKIALAAIDNPEGITQNDLQKARNHGFSERDVFDVVAIAANNKAFTHVLRTFKVEHQGSIA